MAIRILLQTNDLIRGESKRLEAEAGREKYERETGVRKQGLVESAPLYYFTKGGALLGCYSVVSDDILTLLAQTFNTQRNHVTHFQETRRFEAQTNAWRGTG